jgi:hypothetical protein
MTEQTARNMEKVMTMTKVQDKATFIDAGKALNMRIARDELLTVATNIYSAQCIGRGNALPEPQYAVEAARRLIEEVSK